jgi:alpha-beta hydrolase superfamily lysophospholipase
VRRKLAFLAGILLVLALFPLGATWTLARIIAYAPNHGSGAPERLHFLDLAPPDGVGPRGTVIVLHGIRSSSKDLAGIGKKFAARGFRAIVPDLRGHAGSAGDWLTYGVEDAQDLKRLIDAERPPEPIGVFGGSYGGATALQLAAADRRIRAVVAHSTFTSLHEVVPCYVRKYAPPLSWIAPAWWIDLCIDRAAAQGGFDARRASPLRAITETDAPVLILHGGADDNIPPEHGRRLAAAAAGRAELVIVPGCDHDSINRSKELTEDAVAWLAERLAAAQRRAP